MKTRPVIYEFTDYRLFLAKMFDFRKSHNPHFSYQRVADKLGTSRAYFKNIIDGRRHITLDKITVLAEIFELVDLETDFLLILLLLATVQDERLKDRFRVILGSLDGQRYLPATISMSLHDQRGNLITTEWLAGVIQEMAKAPEFKLDSKWIQERLIDKQSVTIEEIETTIQSLLKQKLIRKVGDRFEVGTEIHQHINPHSAEDAMKMYKAAASKTFQVLDHAAEYRPIRFFVGSLGFSESQVGKLNEAFARYHETVVGLSNQSAQVDQVMYFSNCFFRLAKI